MTILIIILSLIIISQLIYWIKPFIKEDYKELYDASNPCIYYRNDYFGIAFYDITKDARLLGWQWLDDASDKCIYFCTICITFNISIK
jgi:hypothetical protein